MADEWEAEWHKSDQPAMRDDPGYWTINGEVTPKRCGVIADTLNRDHCISPEEDRRNVKLMAAAKGLLAACKKMLPLLEHAEYCESCADDGNGPRLRQRRRDLAEVRATIANAESR